MRKIYLASFIILACSTMNAQLSLTKTNNAPIAGSVESTNNFDSTIAVPKATGTNKTWNFMSLTQVGGVSSVTYVASGSTPYASTFPSANLATDDGFSYYNYYNSQTASLQQLGGKDQGGQTIFSNPATMMIWPFTYGSTNTDAFAAAATYTSSSNYNYTGNMVINGTGTGTVILPGGQSFTNCLQVTRTYTFYVSGAFTGTVTSRDYEYWHSAYRSPLVTVSYQTVKEPTVTTKDCYINVNSIANVGIEEIKKDDNKLIVFPNPVKDKLNVVLTDNALAEEIELYDVSGKLVIADKKANSLYTSDLQKGVYMLVVKYKNKRLSEQIIIGE